MGNSVLDDALERLRGMGPEAVHGPFMLFLSRSKQTSDSARQAQ